MQPAAPEAVQEPVFTPEEQAQIDAFSKQIDVTDTNLVFSYGANAQQGIAEFSDTALENVKTRESGRSGRHDRQSCHRAERLFPPTRRRKRASSAGSSRRSTNWNCSRPATTRPRSMWTRSAKVWNSIGAAAQGHRHARPPLRAEPDLFQGTVHVRRRRQEAAGRSARHRPQGCLRQGREERTSRRRAGCQGPERKVRAL